MPQRVRRARACRVRAGSAPSGGPRPPEQQGLHLHQGQGRARPSLPSRSAASPAQACGRAGRRAVAAGIAGTMLLATSPKGSPRLRDRYGAAAICGMRGTGPRAGGVVESRPLRLGSPNAVSVDLHICYAPSLIAENVTVGTSTLMERGPDYENVPVHHGPRREPSDLPPPAGQGPPAGEAQQRSEADRRRPAPHLPRREGRPVAADPARHRRGAGLGDDQPDRRTRAVRPGIRRTVVCGVRGVGGPGGGIPARPGS